jgi:hypothetical protein
VTRGSSSERLTQHAASVVLALFAASYLLTAYMTLDAASRRVPALAAGTTLLLLALEWLLKMGRARTGQGERPHARLVSVSPGASERAVLLGVVALLAGIYLLGFLVTLPVYLLAAVALLGGRSWWVGSVTALATTFALWVVFERVLGLRLFPGILFA